jgi:hypothetical protein
MLGMDFPQINEIATSHAPPAALDAILLIHVHFALLGISIHLLEKNAILAH